MCDPVRTSSKHDTSAFGCRRKERVDGVGENTIALQHASLTRINEATINHAREIANEMGATAVPVYVDVLKSWENMEILIKERRCILAARNRDVIKDLTAMEGAEDRIIRVPYIDLARLSQVKVAAIVALSNGLLHSGDRVVCLSGSPKCGILDNLMVLDIG